MANEIEVLQDALPFDVTQDGPEPSIMRHSILNWMGAAKDLVPPYWSRSRDVFLRKFYTESDPVKITTGTFIHKVSTIPVSVIPRDRSVSRHVRQARVLNENLLENSGVFAGLRSELEKMIADYLTQDNGCFAIIMGDGRPDGPIIGPALGIFHLDAEFCYRTGMVETL